MNSTPTDNHLHTWPELYSGTLIKRYKRFLADVLLDSGETVTAHCANSGTMKECALAGQPVYLSYHDNPKRKLKYTWEMIKMPESLTGVNTIVPNKLVKAAIENGHIAELTGYDNVRPEVKTSEGSRLDLMLTGDEKGTCYVEIKNCTLVKNGHAFFPDAVTTRGKKHLDELMRLKKEGNRAVIFYLIQRMDAEIFSPAVDIDPNYAKTLILAQENGVEILAYDTKMDLTGISTRRRIPVQL